MALSPEQKIESYKSVLRTFRNTRAPALVGQSVRDLYQLSAENSTPITLGMAVRKKAQEFVQMPQPLGEARAKALESTHELVKFISDTPEERASNRVLNSLDRVNAIKFFGPVRNESRSFQARVVQQVAADAASLAPVRSDVLAGKIRMQQKALREIDLEIKTERQANRRARLEELRKERLKEAAALVTAAKVKELQDARRFRPFDLKKLPTTEAKARVRVVLRKIADLERDIGKATLRLKTMKPGIQRTMLFNVRAKNTAELRGLKRRLSFLRQGQDKVSLRKVVTQRPRTRILLEPGALFQPRTDLVTVLVRYLAQRIPRRAGESRRKFLLRLRMYVQRAMARYAANSVQEPDPAAAAEAAAVATVTDDAPAIEAEVDAGGVAEDPAAEAMSEVVEEYIPVMEQAAADLAPETVENSEPDEFVADDAVVADTSPETIDQDLEDAFETLDIEGPISLEQFDLEIEDDARPWYQNPVVLGGAAVVALLILRR